MEFTDQIAIVTGASRGIGRAVATLFAQRGGVGLQREQGWRRSIHAVDRRRSRAHVRVNAVAAGPTSTDSVRVLMESDFTGAASAVTKSLPPGRLAEPDEIAEVVMFLASRRASCITGQVVHANCGGLMA